MIRLILLVLTLVICILPSGVYATDDSLAVGAGQDASTVTQKLFQNLEKNVTRLRLSNGLRILIYERRQAPIFTGQIWVKVGGVDEVTGRTGLSHFLEHMAFKGSRTIGTKDYKKEQPLLKSLDALMKIKPEERDDPWQKRFKEVATQLKALWRSNEFSELYQRKGAVGLNAGTGNDYTVYMVSLPSNAVDLWMWMESDRLLNPVFRQFYKEREVIQEERRMRVDNSPGGKLYEALLATAFWMHPNRLPVIGWPSDMKRLSAPEMSNLYKTYYRPDNIVIVLVGDLNALELKPKLEKYFGRLPLVNSKLPEVTTIEEVQEGAREATINFKAQPQLLFAYHKPVFPSEDDAQFSVLHEILAGGRSAILPKEFVQRRRLASTVYTTEGPGERFPSLFIVGANPVEGVSNETLKNELIKSLNKLKIEPVSEKIVESAKRRVRASFIRSLKSNYGLARMLGKNELLWGDWKVVLKVYEQILSTSPKELMDLAKKYFKNSNLTYVHLENAS